MPQDLTIHVLLAAVRAWNEGFHGTADALMNLALDARGPEFVRLTEKDNQQLWAGSDIADVKGGKLTNV